MSAVEPVHMTRRERSPETFAYTSAPNSSAANAAVHEGNTKLVPWLMLTAILSGFAVAFSCFTFYQLTRSEREFKIWQLEVQNQSAILIREGLKQPTDLANGAAGNYQYQPRKQPAP